MHASVISEVVMQIRMEKFPGVKLESPRSRRTAEAATTGMSPLAPVNYYNDASYTICVHNTLPE